MNSVIVTPTYGQVASGSIFGNLLLYTQRTPNYAITIYGYKLILEPMRNYT